MCYAHNYVSLLYEGETPTRQRHKPIPKLIRRVMGSHKVVVQSGVLIEPEDMAKELKQHSQRMVLGEHHSWAEVNEYVRATPKPRN